jgi:Flp pilus assembly protein TadB
MLTALFLAAAVAAGVPLPIVVIGAAAALSPPAALAATVLAGLAAARSRREGGRPGEAAMLRLLGSELASGASIRSGIAALAERNGDNAHLGAAARFAIAGAPMDRVSTHLAGAFPGNGRLLAAAITLGSITGAGLGSLVARLAERADAHAEMDRELRAATVQARLSTLVVGVAPLVFTGALVLAGAVPAPWRSTGILLAVSAAGVVLEVAGCALVVVMLRRHAR